MKKSLRRKLVKTDSCDRCGGEKGLKRPWAKEKKINSYAFFYDLKVPYVVP
ncbi:hypothetical protein TRIP_B40016 [uncultured Desulfatiglans sp.]|nr:hypothetical protein TRIP_B40016 [uncultured Desulfatiglans sp.]